MIGNDYSLANRNKRTYKLVGFVETDIKSASDILGICLQFNIKLVLRFYLQGGLCGFKLSNSFSLRSADL